MKRVMMSAMLGAIVGGSTVSAQENDRATTPDGLPKAFEMAVRDGRLAVFGPGEHAGNAWGSVCLASIGPADGGGVSIRQTYLFWQPRYFYPASTVKLYAAIAAYEQMNAMARMYPDADLSEKTPLRIHPLFEGETVREIDPTRERSAFPFGDPPITIEHEAHKIFVISDNDAFNTLYDFVGQRDLNRRVRSWGTQATMVLHRLSVGWTEEENRLAPMIDLGLSPGSPQIGERRSTLEHFGTDTMWMSEVSMTLGTGFIRSGELVQEPFDFNGKNFTLLKDLQFVLAKLLFPKIANWFFETGDGGWLGPTSGRPLDLTDAQRAQLIASATMYPRESESPRYDPAEYPDDHAKFLLPGLLRVRPLEEWRVVNKIGLAYGFVTENAYVEHRPTGHAVFVAAVIHRNPNGIYNDNQYDYATTLAEMATLGEVVGRALVGD